MPFESVVTPCSAIDLRTDPNVGNEPQLPVSAECCHLGRHLPNDRYSQRPSPEPAGANTLASLTQPQRQENQCRLMAECCHKPYGAPDVVPYSCVAQLGDSVHRKFASTMMPSTANQPGNSPQLQSLCHAHQRPVNVCIMFGPQPLERAPMHPLGLPALTVQDSRLPLQLVA